MSPEVVGKWTVQGKAARVGYALCRCACGTEREVRIQSLKSGGSRSCGCDVPARMSALLKGRARTHGRAASDTYRSWQAMKSRCGNPKHRAFKDYGARGIVVCERWADSFENFLADMGERPPGATLDRKDGDGNYEPGNCRWASRKEQQRNRRVTRFITINGERLSAAEWQERLGLAGSTFRYRVARGLIPGLEQS